MSTTTSETEPACQPGTDLVALPVPAAAIPEPAVAAEYADVTEQAELRPVIPEHLQTWAGIKTEIGLHLHRHWHRARFHGIRMPAYVVKTVAYAVLGAVYLTGRVIAWWHWLDGKILESQAVARGTPGHADAMKAHTQGLKTRSRRGKILAVCMVLAAIAPWRWCSTCRGGGGRCSPSPRCCSWPGPARPAGHRIIGTAIVPPDYSPPTHEIITRALGSLGIAQINAVLKPDKDGKVGHPVRLRRHARRARVGRCSWTCPTASPPGTSSARREELASGLRRPLSATWPAGVPGEHEGRAGPVGRAARHRKPKPPAVSAAEGRADGHVRRAPVRHRPAAAHRSARRCSRSTG